MKKLLILVLLVTSPWAHAQVMKEKREQLKALKVAYITNELQLTPEEAARFWPIFNAFEAQQKEIRKQKLKTYLELSDLGDYDKLSEKDAAQLVNQMEAMEDEIHQARKKLWQSLKTAIPAVKMLKLKKAEEQFNRRMLQKLKEGGKW